MPDKLTKDEETQILLDLYLDACTQLNRLTEILTSRGYSTAELAIYAKEHRELREE